MSAKSQVGASAPGAVGSSRLAHRRALTPPRHKRLGLLMKSLGEVSERKIFAQETSPGSFSYNFVTLALLGRNRSTWWPVRMTTCEPG